MITSKSLIINCGASHVTYGVFDNKDGSLIVEELQIEPLQYDYSDEEHWLGALTESLKRILTSVKTKGPAILIAPGYQLLTKMIKVPHVEENRQPQVIAFEAQQNIPYPLSDVIWGHQIIADDGVEVEVVLIAYKAVGAHQLCETVSSLGISPESIQASSLLDYNAFRYVYQGVTEPTLLMNIGARSSNLLFVDQGEFFVRNIALGGNTLTQSLADGLGKTFVEAEATKIAYFDGELKYGENDSSAGIMTNAVDGFMRRIGQEVTRSIVNYKRQKKGKAPTSILLTGQGSRIPGLLESLTETQKMSVDYFDPTQVLTPGPNVDPEFLSNAYAQLSEIVGYASRFVLSDSVGVDLLPPEVAKDQAFSKKKISLIAAVVCLSLMPLPVINHYSSIASTYNVAVDSLTQQMVPLNKRYREIGENRKEAEAIQAQIQDLEQLVRSKSNWVNFFADLQNRLMNVKDAWLDELEIIRRQSEGTNAANEATIYSLKLKGRMLLRSEGTDTIGLKHQIAAKRVKTLIYSITESAFIDSVEGLPQFDPSDPNVLTFAFILNINPDTPL